MPVIHGHTIADEAYFNLPYEVNIDTRCFLNGDGGYNYRKGKLTCIKVNKENLINSSIYQVKNGITDQILVSE